MKTCRHPGCYLFSFTSYILKHMHTHTQTDTFSLTVTKRWVEYYVIFKEASAAKQIFVLISFLLRRQWVWFHSTLTKQYCSILCIEEVLPYCNCAVFVCTFNFIWIQIMLQDNVDFWLSFTFAKTCCWDTLDPHASQIPSHVCIFNFTALNIMLT